MRLELFAKWGQKCGEKDSEVQDDFDAFLNDVISGVAHFQAQHNLYA